MVIPVLWPRIRLANYIMAIPVLWSCTRLARDVAIPVLWSRIRLENDIMTTPVLWSCTRLVSDMAILYVLYYYVVIDRFYTALFSDLEQTHCPRM